MTEETRNPEIKVRQFADSVDLPNGPEDALDRISVLDLLVMKGVIPKHFRLCPSLTIGAGRTMIIPLPVLGSVLFVGRPDPGEGMPSEFFTQYTHDGWPMFTDSELSFFLISFSSKEMMDTAIKLIQESSDSTEFLSLAPFVSVDAHSGSAQFLLPELEEGSDS